MLNHWLKLQGPFKQQVTIAETQPVRNNINVSLNGINMLRRKLFLKKKFNRQYS